MIITSAGLRLGDMVVTESGTMRPRAVSAEIRGDAATMPEGRGPVKRPDGLTSQQREVWLPRQQNAGRDARDAAGPAHAPLTRAELRVAALAARGCVNREIAERLFITPSTVEQHLTRVFKKLGITGRDFLPTSLSAVSWQDSGAPRKDG
ncbi:LuxR family transcriptional regulator [Kibdelosporangium aridum]|uniref:LuxR family transcriptional regulator n=2 Tax=Pseudonocardiaceae TaxID=2070 RepID=A0A428ZIV9_KIBAR|nr:helix-turn-helix transcriptional regulator [Kibdelosporangium aridum]RSM88019.1 LuxR family transcriptional regulator [Kibdelosporangium aridum]CAB45048.1 putative transcriptional regulator [Amycolatopsis orientalis]